MNIKNSILVLTCLAVLSSPVFAKPDKEKDKAKTLPPGLEKKQSKGKPLPPGWQKKLKPGEVLEDDIYARGRVVVPLDREGRITIEVDGTLLRLHEKTRKIIDIIND